MKKVLICAIVTTFLCTVGLIGVSLAETDKGPAEITFDTKKPVVFPHAAHQAKNECKVCHHSKGDDGKQVAYVDGQKIEKCETCHNADSGMDPKLSSLKDVGHERCKGCHKDSGDKNLTKCGTCHSKK